MFNSLEEYPYNFHWYFTKEKLHILLLSIIFSLPIFILITFLCFRFLHKRSSSSSQHDEESGVQTRQEHVGGLAAGTISALPIFMFKLSSSKNDNYNMESECSICLGCYEDEEIVKMMPKCGHGFHSLCLDKWLGNCSTCPLCRSSVDVDSSTTLLAACVALIAA
ncbi:hypothetical protein HAX54_016636 [Datura stramonium]|uniref:RING-type domain-containing protein n=1 Tax=Datura stramonium TaxID=4076 RepID=A0ABS8UKV4_DATST|nr:hypothetical protein [Datura stramonium]